jgi:hypothetical protein
MISSSDPAKRAAGKNKARPSWLKSSRKTTKDSYEDVLAGRA